MRTNNALSKEDKQILSHGPRTAPSLNYWTQAPIADRQLQQTGHCEDSQMRTRMGKNTDGKLETEAWRWSCTYTTYTDVSSIDFAPTPCQVRYANLHANKPLHRSSNYYPISSAWLSRRRNDEWPELSCCLFCSSHKVSYCVVSHLRRKLLR